MNNQIMQKLSAISDNAIAFFAYLQANQLLLALFAGLTLPFIFFLDKDEHNKAPVWQRCIIVFSFICLLFGTLSPLSFSFVYYFYEVKSGFNTSAVLWVALIAFTTVGVVFHYVARRLLAPELDKLKHKLIKKSSLERNVRTDVRNVKSLLPSTKKYNPEDYMGLDKRIFIGLDEHHQPIYIPVTSWQKQHAAIIGTTGAGKGVATGLLLTQSIMAGEGVFVLDPKDDEWAPHLFRKACEDAGKPFALINLNKPEYQLNLIADMTADQLEELFIAGLSLAEKGEAADFYRIDDRRAARAAAQLITDNPTATIRDLFNSEYVQSLGETIKGFFGKIEELALLNAINAVDGFDLKKIFDEGGCCYVIGSLRNSKVIMTQRMILVRLLQLAETRDRVNSTPRPIAIFLDELKYHLSRPALEGLGAARDKGVHIIMAFQAIDDLRDCPADLNGDAVVGAVVENAKFKLVYRLMNPETAEWVARMSGTILVDDESRTAKTSAVLTETIDDKRTIRQADRYYVDENMLLNLPDFVSYIFTTSHLPRAALISPIKVKKRALVVHAAPLEIQKAVHKELDFVENIATSSAEIKAEPKEESPLF
jgi:hypothetical protein